MRMATLFLAAVMAALVSVPAWAQVTLPATGVDNDQIQPVRVVVNNYTINRTAVRPRREADPKWERFERVNRFGAMRQSWALHTQNKGEHTEMRGAIDGASRTANEAAVAAKLAIQKTTAVTKTAERETEMNWMPLLWGILVGAMVLALLGMWLSRADRREQATVATTEATARQVASTAHQSIMGARPVVYGRTIGAPGTPGYFAEWRATAEQAVGNPPADAVSYRQDFGNGVSWSRTPPQPEHPATTEPVLYATRRDQGACGGCRGAKATVGDVIVTVGADVPRRTPREGNDDGEGSSHTKLPKPKK